MERDRDGVEGWRGWRDGMLRCATFGSRVCLVSVW